MLLPPEVLEKIFSYLNYKILRSAIRVNKQWQAIVFHQAKQRCLRKMSRCALADYEHNLWGKCETGRQWAQLYDNWQSWRNISMEVDFKVDTKTIEFNEDEMINYCMLGDYIAVGTIDKIFIYNMDDCIKEFSVDFLIELHFIPDEDIFLKPIGLVAICLGSIRICDLHRDLEPLVIDGLHELSRHLVSVHNSRISYLTSDAKLRILRIQRDNTDSLISETEYMLQIEDPNIQSRSNSAIAISLTETSCCVLCFGRFYAVYLDNDHVTKVLENVSFSDIATLINGPSYTWILPNNFIITSYFWYIGGC